VRRNSPSMSRTPPGQPQGLRRSYGDAAAGPRCYHGVLNRLTVQSISSQPTMGQGWKLPSSSLRSPAPPRWYQMSARTSVGPQRRTSLRGLSTLKQPRLKERTGIARSVRRDRRMNRKSPWEKPSSSTEQQARREHCGVLNQLTVESIAIQPTVGQGWKLQGSPLRSGAQPRWYQMSARTSVGPQGMTTPRIISTLKQPRLKERTGTAISVRRDRRMKRKSLGQTPSSSTEQQARFEHRDVLNQLTVKSTSC